MGFIERYLGLSPDNGDGSFEAMLLIMLVVFGAGLALAFLGIGKTKGRKQPNRK